MLVRVNSGISFNRYDISAKALEMLRNELSFANPEFAERSRLGLDVRFTPEMLCYLKEKGERIRLPRGAVRLLKSVASECGIALEFKDERVLHGPKLETAGTLRLRDYQERAVNTFLKQRQGYLVMPCGSGKSSTGMGAIASAKEPVLVLVMSLDLAEQWRTELAAKIGLTATVVGGGEEVMSDVTIGVAQALIRWDTNKLDAFLCRFGMLIIDEVQHAPSATISAIVDRCPAHYRLGLTATPEREDGLTQLLDLYVGDKLIEIKHDELVKAGVLVIPEFRIIETPFTYPYESKDDYAEMLETLTWDTARNDMIAGDIESEARAGNVCLALSGRIDHCEQLAALLKERGIRAEPLTSSVKKKRRKELLEEARKGELLVLLATSLADEGLDLPRLSRVFLVFPGKSKGRTIQRVGRLMRPHPDKANSVLYDFADRKVSILRRHHLERRKLYALTLGIPASKLECYVDNGGKAA